MNVLVLFKRGKNMENTAAKSFGMNIFSGNRSDWREHFSSTKGALWTNALLYEIGWFAVVLGVAWELKPMMPTWTPLTDWIT